MVASCNIYLLYRYENGIISVIKSRSVCQPHRLNIICLTGTVETSASLSKSLVTGFSEIRVAQPTLCVYAYVSKRALKCVTVDVQVLSSWKVIAAAD